MAEKHEGPLPAQLAADLARASPEDFEAWARSQDPVEVERVLWWMENGDHYHSRPVSIDEFVESPHYMDCPEGSADAYFPAVREAAREVTSGRFVEAVCTGSTGASKTHLAILVTCYCLYVLLCLRRPHAHYGLSSTSDIVVVVQSLDKDLAMVPYRTLRATVDAAPVFRRAGFRYDRDLKSEMRFMNRVVVSPMTGQMTATLGQNVIGGILDEVGSMAVVHRSLRTRDRGVFDQAYALYQAINRRRKNRFMRKGRVPGMLCLVGSKQYPDDFLHRKLAEARQDPSIYVYDKRTWDVQPWKYTDARFKVFAGDATRRPRILKEGEELPEEDASLVVEVPEEHRSDFEQDMAGALRDVAGYSTETTSPFMADRTAVGACFGKSRSVLTLPEFDLRATRPKALRDLWAGTEKHPRAAHLDMALSGDSVGGAVAHVPGFRAMKRAGGIVELLPVIRVDALWAVHPPKGGEVDLESCRGVVVNLRRHGLPVKWVTTDGWDAANTLQVMASRGFLCGLESPDKKPQHAYTVLKRALYDGRVEAPQHDLCLSELVGLERDPETGKIDHRPGFCFTGETRVALADGTQPTFKELAEKYGPDEVFYVYSIDRAGQVCIAEARNPRVMRDVEEVVEVELDTFDVVRCTPNHLFMTLDREWVQAQNLTPDVRLMPLYRTVNVLGGTAGYETVWCPGRRERILTHHVAVGRPERGSIVHHKDGNKRNNCPPNLEHLTKTAHVRHHGTELWEARRAAMRAGFDAHYADPANREAQSARVKRTWAEGKFGRSGGQCAIEGCEKKRNARGLCGVHYQRARRARLKDLRTSAQKNHRVLSVRRVSGQPEPVYDLTVPGLANFALASGVFVHNSKDVADALACVVLVLSMQLEVWAMHGLNPSEMPESLAAASSGDRKKAIDGRI